MYSTVLYVKFFIFRFDFENMHCNNIVHCVIVKRLTLTQVLSPAKEVQHIYIHTYSCICYHEFWMSFSNLTQIYWFKKFVMEELYKIQVVKIGTNMSKVSINYNK